MLDPNMSGDWQMGGDPNHGWGGDASQALAAAAAIANALSSAGGHSGYGMAPGPGGDGRSSMNHRPNDGLNVPGLTDRRFEGIIALFKDDKSYGFIRCEQIRESVIPDKDIFVHKNQMGQFHQNERVSFGVFLNRSGKPQATELGPPGNNHAPIPMENVASIMQALSGYTSGGGHGGGYNAGPPVANPALPAPPPAPAPYGAGPGYQGGSGYGGGGYADRGSAYDVREVEVPLHLSNMLFGEGGSGLQQIVMSAGGDVSVQFTGDSDSGTNKIVQIRGPAVSAYIGACLVLQRISELQ